MERSLKEVNEEIVQLQERLSMVKGTDTEVYTRIVGYHRAVANWNKGKKEEYSHRKVFDLNMSDIKKVVISEICDHSEKHDHSEPAKTPVDIMSKASNNKPASRDDIAYYKFFYSQYCHNCPPVKDAIKKSSIPGDEVDVGIDLGLNLSRKFNVMKTPTVVLLDKNENVVEVVHTVEGLKKILNG